MEDIEGHATELARLRGQYYGKNIDLETWSLEKN